LSIFPETVFGGPARSAGDRSNDEDSELGDLSTPAEADIHQLLHMINRDLRGANALARACLAGLAASSPEARQAISQVLILDGPAATDETTPSWSPEAVVARAHQQSNLHTLAHERLCEALERALVRQAALIEDDTIQSLQTS
jgi:hypothetical protein